MQFLLQVKHIIKLRNVQLMNLL